MNNTQRFGILIVGICIILGLLAWYIYSNIQIINEVGKQSKEIKESLDKINQILPQIATLPAEIATIRDRISNIEYRINAIDTDTKNMKELQANISRDLETLEKIESDLNVTQKELEALQKQYPPVQTQNIIFENVSQKQINEAISNAVTMNVWNYVGVFFIGFFICIAVFKSLVSPVINFIFNNPKK